MIKLKPCPFCGSDDIVFDYEGKDEFGNHHTSCHCGRCGSHAGVLADTKDKSGHEAIFLWNSRAEHTCHDVKRGDESAFFRCSECGGVLASTVGSLSIYDDRGYFIHKPCYCPVCGAKVINDA